MCVCLCVCVHMHGCVCACVRACMHACVCVCVAKPAAVELRCHATALIFSFMVSFVFKQQVLFKVDFLSVTLDHRVQGGARGQNLGHLKDLFLLLFFSYVINHI